MSWFNDLSKHDQDIVQSIILDHDSPDFLDEYVIFHPNKTVTMDGNFEINSLKCIVEIAKSIN